MRGPVNPSMNDECGLLVEGTDNVTEILINDNPTYYAALLENYGLHKEMDLYAYELYNKTYASDKMKRMVNLIRERSGVTIRAMKFGPKAEFTRDVQILKDIYNAAWEKNWGFVKITDEEFDFLANDLKQIAEPSLVMIAEKDGRPVGFALSLPNINECLIYNKKGGIIGGLGHLLTKKKKISSVAGFLCLEYYLSIATKDSMCCSMQKPQMQRTTLVATWAKPHGFLKATKP